MYNCGCTVECHPPPNTPPRVLGRHLEQRQVPPPPRADAPQHGRPQAAPKLRQDLPSRGRASSLRRKPRLRRRRRLRGGRSAPLAAARYGRRRPAGGSAAGRRRLQKVGGSPSRTYTVHDAARICDRASGRERCASRAWGPVRRNGGGRGGAAAAVWGGLRAAAGGSSRRRSAWERARGRGERGSASLGVLAENDGERAREGAWACAGSAPAARRRGRPTCASRWRSGA
jgi:hypothetical protein